MFPSHSLQQAVLAAQLATSLDDYEAGVARLIEGRWDPELYRLVSDHFDRMQQYASDLPALSFSWTELLISRVELLHALWSFRAPARINGRVVALHERHKVRVAEVRRNCHQYVERSRAAAAAPPA